MSNPTIPVPPRLVAENNAAAAIISKLNTTENNNQNSSNFNILNMNTPDVSLSVSEKIKNNDNIVELFPDTELAIQILVSSIISPNDLLTTNINFNSPDIKLPTSIKQTLTSMIKTYVEKEYCIENKLPTIVREALFTKGAYIEVIIPEAAIDEMINNYEGQISVESITDNINKSKFSFLGTEEIKINVSLEDYVGELPANNKTNTKGVNKNNSKDKNVNIELTEKDLGISITDNPTILNSFKIMSKVINSKVKNTIYGTKLSKESIEGENATKVVKLNSIFKNNSTIKKREFISVNNRSDANRESVGRPLVMKLPTESVIPVHVVNDPTNHLGYFILLDNNGVPVDVNSEDYNHIDQASMYSNNMNQDSKLNMITKAKNALYGITRKDATLNNIEEIYGNIVEDTINKKLKNGMYGDLVEVKDNADLYRVMLMRALRAQQTRLLFLPKELVAYYAFDYRENGTGKSLLEKVAVLYSIRAILLFTTFMSTIANNTNITEVTATLEEHDPDPEKTMEKIMSEVLKTRQTMLPLGVTKLEDLTEWVHKLGFKFNFKHPGIPDMQIETSSKPAGDRVVPDEGLSDDIKEHIIMSFGLTPEMIQAGYNVDFATTVVAKNLLLAKRVTQLQNILNPLIKDHIVKLLSNDMVIINNIKDIIKNNIKVIQKTIKDSLTKEEDGEESDEFSEDELIEYITDLYINDMDIYLPTPELNEANAMKEAFTGYKTTMEEYIDSIINDEVLPDTLVGSLSSTIPNIQKIIKTILTKKWMSDNNYIPEVSEFLSLDDEGKPLFNFLEEYETYTKSLSSVITPFLKKMSKEKIKSDKKLEGLLDGSSGGYDDGGDDGGYDDGSDDTGDNMDEGTGDDLDNMGESDEGIVEGEENVDSGGEETKEEKVEETPDGE